MGKKLGGYKPLNLNISHFSLHNIIPFTFTSYQGIDWEIYQVDKWLDISDLGWLLHHSSLFLLPVNTLDTDICHTGNDRNLRTTASKWLGSECLLRIIFFNRIECSFIESLRCRTKRNSFLVKENNPNDIVNPGNQQKHLNLQYERVYFSNSDIVLKYTCNLNTPFSPSLYNIPFQSVCLQNDGLKEKALFTFPQKK